MSAADDLIRGAIDMHVHFGPDPRVERRADALALARAARDLSMRALVLKSHEYPTQPVAYTANLVVPEVRLIGSVCLDDEVGGLNPLAVEASAAMGARVVWLPTYNAAAYRRHAQKQGGVSVLDEAGRLVPRAQEVLEVVRARDLVLATGHLSISESLAVVQRAREMGVHRVVVTHISTCQRWYGATPEEMRELAHRGAFLEHCVNAMSPAFLAIPPKEMVAMVRAVGAEQCILSSDFGQWYHPMPPEGLRMGLAALLVSGLSQGELELMVQRNPAQLLGLQ